MRWSSVLLASGAILGVSACSLARDTIGAATDAAHRPDADAGAPLDARVDGDAPDMRIDDSGPDVGGLDAGPPDMGPADMGAPDGGPTDAGPRDAGCAPYPLAGSPAVVSVDLANSVLHPGGSVRVIYSGFPGTQGDWVEVSVPCLQPWERTAWSYTLAMSTSGMVDIALPVSVTAGSYDVRGVFASPANVVQALSDSIDVTP
jgi:hypothetical protein